MNENVEGKAGLTKDEKILLAIVLGASTIINWLFLFAVLGYW